MRSPLLAALLLVSLVIAGAIGMFFLLRSTGSTAPIDSLPRDTSLLLRAQASPRIWRELSLTGMARHGEEETQQALAGVVGRALAREGIPIAPTATELARALDRETVVALVPGDRDEPEGLAVIQDLGGHAAAVPDMARQYTHTILGDRAEAAWTSRSYHGRDYHTFSLPGGKGGLNVAGLKGLGILTTTGASMRRILDTVDGRVESLRFERTYRVTRDRLGKSADAYVYASGSWIAGQLDRRMPPGQARRALRLMGLDAVSAAGLEIDLHKGLFRERLFVALRGDRRSLPIEIFDTPPRSFSPSGLIPAGLPYHVALSFSSLGAVYRKLPEILASATGGDRKALRARLHGFEQFMAIDLDRDLFGALGGEMTAGFGGGSPYPRSAENRSVLGTPIVAALRLRSPARMTPLLERMDGLARAMDAYRSVELDGQAMTGYDFTATLPWSPSYRVTKGHLVAASSADLLARALNAEARQLSFANQQEIGPIAELLPDRAHVFFFGDTARLADLARIDPVADLRPTGITARISPEGFLLEGVSPISPSLLLWMWLESALEDGQETAIDPVPPGDEIPY